MPHTRRPWKSYTLAIESAARRENLLRRARREIDGTNAGLMSRQMQERDDACGRSCGCTDEHAAAAEFSTHCVANLPRGGSAERPD